MGIIFGGQGQGGPEGVHPWTGRTGNLRIKIMEFGTNLVGRLAVPFGSACDGGGADVGASAAGQGALAEQTATQT